MTYPLRMKLGFAFIGIGIAWLAGIPFPVTLSFTEIFNQKPWLRLAGLLLIGLGVLLLRGSQRKPL